MARTAASQDFGRLSYLMVAARKRGDVNGVRKAIAFVIDGPREKSLPECDAMAINICACVRGTEKKMT